MNNPESTAVTNEETTLEAAVSDLESAKALPKGLRDRLRKALAVADEAEAKEAFMGTLKSRFEKNRKLHEGVDWAVVEKALAANPEKLASLKKLEETGGEPDVFMVDGGDFVFGDCSVESPKGRRDLNYHQASEMAMDLGVDLMDEAQYRHLQSLIPVDHNTWSWLQDTSKTLDPGSAMLGNRSGGVVRADGFVVGLHHSERGWRAALRVKKA